MRHYLIVANQPVDGKAYYSWTGGSGNGGWEEVGSYYRTEKDAQAEIDNLKLDAHVEFDEW